MENKITKIRTRDNRIAKFNLERINDAILKSLQAAEQGDEALAKKITDEFNVIINKRFKKDEIPSVEEVQDIIEEVLVLEGLTDTVKSFILYRDQRRKIRETVISNEDSIERIDNYLDRSDWEVNENANMAFSLQGLNHHAVSYNIKKYWLNKIYPKEIRDANENGDFHLHNLDSLAPYCFSGDTKVPLLNGEVLTMKELTKKYKNKKFYVYSIDEKNNIVAGEAYNPRMTRKRTEVIKVILDNNEEIICTPDHKFMLRDGSYMKAKNLKSDISLMPLYLDNNFRDTSYKGVLDLKNNNLTTLNHKVKRIEVINKKINVYDLTVKKYHNFALNSGIFVHNCSGWSLYDFLKKGFGGTPGKLESTPPKHFRTVLGQIVNFIYTLSGEVAGAVSFSNFDTLLAPFIRYDNLTERQVKQSLQEFLFNMATPTRVGFQCPFSNITLDLTPSPSFAKVPVIIGGENKEEKYSDFQEEMNTLNKCFFEVMLEGDKNQRVFTFPIPTVNITKEFDWDNPTLKPMWEATAKYGINYFANYINSDMKPSDTRSMCCRLRLDLRELMNRGGGGLFGSGDLTGSIGVVTINMPRIGYLSKTKKEFFKRLDYIMELAKQSLELKRKTIETFADKGLYPYSRFYLADIKATRKEYYNNHFSTIGLVGMNEAIKNFLDEDISTSRGKKFALEVMDFMRAKLVKFQKDTGSIYNLEATPSESTSYRLCLKDVERYPDIITAGTKERPYYTNSTLLPANFSDDVFEVLKLQDELQCKYNGGTVLHMFIGEYISDIESLKALIKKTFEKFRLPYITITPTFSICPEHGYLEGEHFKCPKCIIEEPEEIFTNIEECGII